MTQRTIQDTDNRDLTTTVLELDNGDKVTVNPWDLVRNVIENAVDDEFVAEEYIGLLALLKTRVEVSSS